MTISRGEREAWRVSLQPAFMLHSRPYRDTSLLLELLTPEHGRISLVGKGTRRRSRGGSNSALLQPFIPLLVSFSGKGELKNLNAVESAGSQVPLRGDRLFSAMYINELLMRLLHRHDPHPRLFSSYATTLDDMSQAQASDVVLRRFELLLLEELGYSFPLSEDGQTGDPIEPESWYHFHPDLGLLQRPEGTRNSSPAYHGADLLRMAEGDFLGEVSLTAKRLMRQALANHLGDAPLKSRDLFRTGKPGAKPDTNTDTNLGSKP